MTPRKIIIPYGYCQCGCGEQTLPARSSDPRHNRVKGQPCKFLPYHHRIQPRPPIRYGTVKGKPVVYIPLTKGFWTVIDRKNLNKSKGPWCYQKGYAGRRGNVMLHNIILPPPPRMETDHRDGNTLNNMESNLRYGTHQQNTQNERLARSNTSGYKGVHWINANRKWQARIYVNGKRISAGCFAEDQIIEAAKAYDRAASKHYGKFAKLNFPQKASKNPLISKAIVP